MPEIGVYHVPVLLPEILNCLNPRPGQIFVDATVGGAGHAKFILERVLPRGTLIGLDQDQDALNRAARVLAPWASQVHLVKCRFDRLGEALDNLGIDRIDGILFDFGVSSYQLDTPERGFSFKDPDAPLDMRMDRAADIPTAADLLNSLSERDLTDLIRENSDEHWASRIASFIVERRNTHPYSVVGQLVDTVHAAIPMRARPPDIHAATRTFQSLRIAVNQELTVIGHALESAVDRLAKGGKLTTLSYHSLEDRIVKQLLTTWSGRGPGAGPFGDRPAATVELVTRKPIVPTSEEIAANPRSRSAKLRAAVKL